MEIDRIDRSILMVLQKNNRIPNVDLAEQVGLSPPACLKRVKRLREAGVIIGDVSIINPELVGNRITFVVSIEMDSDRGDVYKSFRQSILKYPEVTQCYQISGSYDFLLIVQVESIPVYERFIEGSLRRDLNIRKFHTSISLRTVKFTTEVALSTPSCGLDKLF
ncbi:Lrp/AsnC family transcriptional regulator [Vibrio hepatarius]|uniref:Lrp/AsnC family transcriptional regulator n=1 Tax=Vibrio hepatarius TaxID=171383 RepID=UPI00142D3350|nr:Lrp/AsnC family transcriptional regulator [Vibrio hepatarius]NIY81603.1 Lrp/AsnC family transcriptional regulator [Vibrio hepatarius]NVJ59749.1 Lrp/AsnC family transcriptional regulator [Gammaproteobacteria bacterium]